MTRPPPRSTLFPYTPLSRSPGRHEIDDTQELYYPAVMKAIVDTGYKGFVAQEYIPARKDMIASLAQGDRKSTRLNSSHSQISYAVFCLTKKKPKHSTRAMPC